jgi:glycosyltransferase involved in cell wall biosynthesis
MLAQPDLSFHLVALLPRGATLKPLYPIPSNVVGINHVFLQQLPKGVSSIRHTEKLFERLEGALLRIQSYGALSDIAEVIELLRPHRSHLGRDLLLNSPESWELLLRMYNHSQPESSFLDYFWTWRGLLGGLYSILLAELPAARLYHAVSTGYAGLMAARAHLETGRPAVLTEHGIYTTERRIEIAMADWLYEAESSGLNVSKTRRDLKDLWVDTFVSYSRACYEAADRIITLYEGNQQSQIEDGASPEKLQIIPNGIDYPRYTAIRRDPGPRPLTIALIGRVVPIKDVKTFIRASGLLQEIIPDLQALVLGPTEEDKEYFAECQTLVNHLGLQSTVTFAGRVRLDEYLGRVDAIVLTSISEAQPLAILEAGAAGVPSVATDVGACREMIMGSRTETPPLGAGGSVTPLANPAATAQALAKLLGNHSWHEQCSHAIRERVRRYYNKADLDKSYRDLYEFFRSAPDEAKMALA